MKKLLLLLSILLFTIANSLSAQEIIKTSAKHKISGKAGKPGALIDIATEKSKDELSMNYLVKNNKRKIVYEKYIYDLNTLKQKDVKTIEIEKEKAKTKFRFFRGDNVTRLVLVKNNFTGQMVLEKGYIEVNGSGSYSNFVTELKAKYKDSEKRQQTLVAYKSDADNYNFSFSTIYDAWKPSTGHVATGNALVITMVKPKAYKSSEFSVGTKFNTMIISSEDFSILSKKNIEFEFPYYPFTGTNTPNGGIAVVFMPMNKGALANYSIHGADDKVQQNPKEFILLTIDANGNETGRYPFEVKNANANMKLSINNNGEFLIYGFAGNLAVSPEDEKKPNFFPGDNMQASLIDREIRLDKPYSYDLIKLSKKGEVLVSSSTPLQKLLENTVVNSNEKIKSPKAGKWSKQYKEQAKQSHMFEVNNKFFIQLTTGDEKYHQLLQFSEKGDFVTSYLTQKTGDRLDDTKINKGPNSSLYLINNEHEEGHNNNNGWIKITQIDTDGLNILKAEIPGDKKYFVQGTQTFTYVKELGETIVFLKSGKNVYLGKLPLK